MRACKHCHRSTNSSDDTARVQGWRWFEGTTLGGKLLSDVVCPVCAGTAKVEEGEPGWQVGCHTCHWVYDEDDGIRTGKDAVEVARNHECEPEVWICRPGDEQEYGEHEFDKHGALRKPRIRTSLPPDENALVGV
jgi:RNA polymerase subunit RPABC4/transcription elongation factor Spt4